jgi:hypothetical protein
MSLRSQIEVRLLAACKSGMIEDLLRVAALALLPLPSSAEIPLRAAGVFVVSDPSLDAVRSWDAVPSLDAKRFSCESSVVILSLS